MMFKATTLFCLKEAGDNRGGKMGGEKLRAVREGTVFGRMVVIRYESSRRVVCRCDCGAEVVMAWNNLVLRKGVWCGFTERCRFEEKVRRDEDGCWYWQGSISGRGYGGLSVDGKWRRAHRVAWTLANNMPIPDGLHVMHSCDNPSCVNPEHLSVGTHDDNMQDMVKKGRARSGEGHCNSKLSEEQVLEIRRSTLSGRRLALIYGVSNSTIGKIRRRSIWKHIPPEDTAGANGEEII